MPIIYASSTVAIEQHALHYTITLSGVRPMLSRAEMLAIRDALNRHFAAPQGPSEVKRGA